MLKISLQKSEKFHTDQKLTRKLFPRVFLIRVELFRFRLIQVMEVKMVSAQIDLEQIFQTLDKLRPDELWLVEEHIANLKKSNQRCFPPKTLFDDETFWLPYEDYLTLSESARRNILFYGYDQYGDWIYSELARRFAKWMIVCGGKIVESSYRLQDHPTRERLNAIGMRTGYAPFVFIFPISESDSPALQRGKRLWKRENEANDEASS